ncbi:MAG: hypothetical protein Terrestrivirus1_300 [Terrestrivirus sp.]|jgi:hypothetical protein|uniref:Uncharacterized protein n=1 Tax=Terrestrivirus sp. TaxID=2487775 RepID=A0A3G4ZKR7_9VIRU|nr:MAG: hypothetical protein Terrestrivirus1_300 [Terrestrivirus sp.]
MYNFIDNCKNEHLTIRDVKLMSVGDVIDVVIWDKNFEEYWIWEHAEEKTYYDPCVFFKSNRCKLTYKGDMQWDIYFDFGDTFTHPVHLDVSSLQTDWTWYPIDELDGKIHSDWTTKHIHWTEFPDTTRVGWRGPIMLWDKLKDLPQIYYD